MAKKKKPAEKKADKKAKGKEGKKAKGVKAAAPDKVKTGRGATPAEVAAGIVAMLREKTPESEIWDRWFSRKLVSIEGQMGLAWHGMPAVKSKSQEWYDQHVVHAMEVDGPFVGATGFGVRYSIEVEEKASGTRFQADELAFYTVRNGKVVQEEFMGRAAEAPAAVK